MGRVIDSASTRRTTFPIRALHVALPRILLALDLDPFTQAKAE
jgi:hypothetical protein